MPDGKTGTYTLDTRLPNRYYSEIVLADQNVIEAYNGKSAWHQTQSGGQLGVLLRDQHVAHRLVPCGLAHAPDRRGVEMPRARHVCNRPTPRGAP